MKIILSIFFVSFIAACSPVNVLRLYGARDGNSNISNTGTYCKENCGKIYTYKDGKRVEIKDGKIPSQ